MNSELFFELRGKLVQVFREFLAMDSYHKIFIYDIIAEFADNVQELEDQHHLVDQVLPTVAAQFVGCKPQEGVFVPLFDCLTTLVKVAGVYGLKYEEPAFEFVLKVAAQITEALQVQVKKKSKERVKFEHELRNNQMRCFDFVSTLIEASQGQIVQSRFAAQIPALILSNLKTDDVFLRQLVYSLLGDFAAYCDPAWLAPDIPRVVDALLIDCVVIPASMDAARTYLSIATNAVYALSELIPRFAGALQPAPILNRILKIYESPKVAPRSPAPQVPRHQLRRGLRPPRDLLPGRNLEAPQRLPQAGLLRPALHLHRRPDQERHLPRRQQVHRQEPR